MPTRNRNEKGTGGTDDSAVPPDFAAIVENDPDGCVLFDRECRYVYLNPIAERIFGDNASLRGKVIWDVFPALVEYPLYDALTRSLRERTPVTCKHPSLLHPGSWYEIRCIPCSSERLAVYARDITKTVRSEAEREMLVHELEAERDALRLSEERFRTMSDIVPFGVWMVGADGEVRYLSQSFLKILGMSVEEAREYRWLERVTPDEWEYVTSRWRRSLKTGEPWSMEYHIDGADGSRYAVLSRGQPVRDEEGRITSWVGVLLDITERKRTEETLREREAHLRTVLQTLPVGVWIVDAEGRLLQVNDAALGVWGAGTLKGRVTSDFVARNPETGRYLAPEDWGLQQALEHGTAVTNEVLEIQAFDGSWKTILASALPIRGDDGRIIGGVAVNLDITERVHAERLLAEMLSKQSRIADTLQRSLLLVPPPDTFPGLTVKPIYEAARDDALVGGDFYDLFAVEENKVALVVGDVTGKGLEAAIYTAEVKFALRAFLREYPNPSVAMERLNRFVLDSQRYDGALRGATYVVLAVAVIDTRTGQGVCTSAGIEPPFVVRAATHEAQIMDAGGIMLGVVPEAKYDLSPVALGPGDLLVMFTDGLTEARHAERFFGYDGVVRAVREMSHLPSLADIGQAISDRARAFSAGVQQDDICLLLARRIAPLDR